MGPSPTQETPEPVPASQSDKRFLQALARRPVDRPPFWFMRQAGRYLPEYRAVRETAGGFLDLCYTPDFAVEVTLQPIRRYHMDAAILFADILVIPDALGQPVAYQAGEGPVLEPIRSAAAVARLQTGRVVDHLAPVFETLRRLRTDLPDDVALIGFAGAPWTVATYMVEGGGSPDHAVTKRWALGNEPGFETLIDMLVDATVDYLSAQIDAGAEAVQLFDTWAGALPASGFRRWCVEPTRRIVAALKDAHPGVPVIGFPRGVGANYLAYVKETGVDGISIDSSVSPAWAAATLQPLCAVQGNLDPQYLVTGGDAMLAEARSILEALSDGPYVFNLGHGIVPQTPPEHVAVLSDLLHGS